MHHIMKGKSNSLKNNRIFIHKASLFERIFLTLTMFLFPAFLLFDVFDGAYDPLEEWYKIFMLCTIALAIIFFLFLSAYKDYICLDMKKQKLIIHEYMRLRAIEFPMQDVLSLSISDSTVRFHSFYPVIRIQLRSSTVEILSWSSADIQPYFATAKQREQKLEHFVKLCNTHLNSFHEENDNQDQLSTD